MNPFEKIFNYQIISRLDDAGTFMATAHERAWLKTALAHPAAAQAFTAGTLAKLESMLDPDDSFDPHPHLIEKARSREKQVYHPLLGKIRRLILNRHGIRLSYSVRGDRIFSDQLGVPYKLEYSMVKREWYLLWHRVRHHALMKTKLDKILFIAEADISHERVDRMLERTRLTLESRKTQVLIEILPMYNRELSRILYAFSCFEKEVAYDADRNLYTVKVCLLGEEIEYLLSKLRFLGKRVRVLEGDYVKKRMVEASTKALERYGKASEREEV